MVAPKRRILGTEILKGLRQLIVGIDLIAGEEVRIRSEQALKFSGFVFRVDSCECNRRRIRSQQVNVRHQSSPE